jgi:excisionase family DNA binding protein
LCNNPTEGSDTTRDGDALFDTGVEGVPTVETNEPEELLTPSEVAAMFRVNPKTVTRWARAGRISYIKTLGGHRRFKASEIRRLLEEAEAQAEG